MICSYSLCLWLPLLYRTIFNYFYSLYIYWINVGLHVAFLSDEVDQSMFVSIRTAIVNAASNKEPSSVVTDHHRKYVMKKKWGNSLQNISHSFTKD